MIIKNRIEIINQLAEILKNFDVELNPYDTDVYLYYDSETQTATLDTFKNPDGNSWLNDEHYNIYTDRKHPDKAIDSFDTVEEIAEAIGKTKEVIFEGTKKYLDLSDEEYEDWLNSSIYNIWLDVADFVNCYYCVEIQEAYEKLLPDLTEYEATADEIISGFEEFYESVRIFEELHGINRKYLDPDKHSCLSEED